MLKSLSVLVKPVSSACNIDCKYCFYKDEDKLRESHCNNFMSIESLQLLVKRIFEDAENYVSIVFQGGEPTLIGLNFYKKFIDFLRLYNVRNIKTDLSIQTNGLLLDDDWCKFLKENNFLVGLSFDGNPQNNDLYRVDYDGKGTSSKVVKSIELMKKYGVDFNVLMVITHEGAKTIKESYKFLKDIGVEYLQIIPALDPYNSKRGNQKYSLSNIDLENALIDLYEIWSSDFIKNDALRITYFENIIYKLMGNQFTMCSMNGSCAIESVVESDGSIYPCDFYVSDEWYLGNIKEISFKNAIFSEKAKKFVGESIKVNEKCKTCNYFGLCIGSCKRYQLNCNNTYDNYYCSSFKKFFDYSFLKMQDFAQNLN